MTNHQSVTDRSYHVHHLRTPRTRAHIHADDTSDQALVLCDILSFHDIEVRTLRQYVQG